MGHSSHEKFWWQLCNLLGRELSGFEIFTYGGQHGNEAGVEYPIGSTLISIRQTDVDTLMIRTQGRVRVRVRVKD